MPYRGVPVNSVQEMRIMLSKKVAKALNEQVTKEIASGYLYLQMAAWFETQTLKG